MRVIRIHTDIDPIWDSRMSLQQMEKAFSPIRTIRRLRSYGFLPEGQDALNMYTIRAQVSCKRP